MTPLSLLGSPHLYNLVQIVTGGENARRYALKSFLDVPAGSKIIDIGCGTARSLEYLPQVKYVGVEPSEAYSRHAQDKYGHKARFMCGYFDENAARTLAPYDLVLLLGVLHHCDDVTAETILRDISVGLSPRGRVLILDPCLTPTQTALARKIALMDRGKHVRTPAKYVELATPLFRVTKSETRDGVLNMPTTIHLAELTVPT